MSALRTGGCAAYATNSTVRRRRPNLWLRMQALDRALYWLTALVAVAWVFAVMGMSIAAMLIVAMIPVAFPQALLNIYCKVEATWNRTGLGRAMPFSGAIGVFGIVALALTLTAVQADVAQAQFFKGAETYITTKLAGGAAGAAKAVEIIFAVLRGLFLIYLGISIVRIVQSARNDQDWQDLARTPLIILIAVVLGDVLSAFIIGGA